MMKCNICGSDLKCTLTIDDPLTENEIIRRKYCYNCGITYLTKETVVTIKKRQGGYKHWRIQRKRSANQT